MRLGYFVPRGGAAAAAPARTPGPGYAVGGYYNGGENATTHGSLTSATARFDVKPMPITQRIKIDQIGVVVNTPSGGTTTKISLYRSDANGLPRELIYESDPIGTAASGFVFESVDLTLDPADRLWVGVRNSGAGALITLATAAQPIIGVTGNTAGATTSACIFRGSLTYGDPAPDPYVPNLSELASQTSAVVRFRVAEVL